MVLQIATLYGTCQIAAKYMTDWVPLYCLDVLHAPRRFHYIIPVFNIVSAIQHVKQCTSIFKTYMHTKA